MILDVVSSFNGNIIDWPDAVIGGYVIGSYLYKAPRARGRSKRKKNLILQNFFDEDIILWTNHRIYHIQFHLEKIFSGEIS